MRIRTLYIPRKNTSLENIGSFIYLLNSGSKDDIEGQAEIHHLCEHLLFTKLDKSRYPIFTIFRTTMEYTIFQFLFPAKYFIDCLQQVSSLLWNPCITKEAFNDQYRIIRNEGKYRQKHHVFDYAFHIAKSYWGMPTTCGSITISDVINLILHKHQNSSFHLLSYTGPLKKSEVVSAFECHWFSKHTIGTNNQPYTIDKENKNMTVCGYFKKSEITTVIITTPGYRYVPDDAYRIITNYLAESIRIKMVDTNSYFSHKQLSYPEKSFLIMYFSNNINENKIRSIFNDSLASLYLDKDVDKNRMKAFLQSYEFDWILRCESTANIAKELTCSTFRTNKIMSLQKILTSIHDFDIKKHRKMVDRYLSHFVKCGGELKKMDIV